MATPEVYISGEERAKRRDPAITLLLSVVTLGVYVWVWYYKFHCELRDLGRARGDEELGRIDPAISTLAISLGALIIVPPVVSWFRAGERIARAQALVGVQPSTQGWLVLLLYLTGGLFLLPLLGIPLYVQSGLNRAWDLFPEVPVAALDSASLPAASALTTQHCTACGAELLQGHHFCTSCGAEVPEVSAADAV